MKIELLEHTNIKPINTKILVVLILALVLLGWLPEVAKAGGAWLYLAPEPGNYKTGERFSLDVMIQAEGISVNAAQATIHFSPNKLKVVEIARMDSIFSLWPKKPVWSNSAGEISFVGGLPSPGFLGAERVFTVTFQAKASGRAKIYFSDVKILADGPKGIDIFAPKSQLEYSIDITSDIEITVDNEGDATNPRPLLYLDMKAGVFSIIYYEVEIDEDTFKLRTDEASPWQMPILTPGDHPLLVRAVDEEGNIVEDGTEVIVESIPVPKITFSPRFFRSGEEVFYISGTAIPESLVLIFLKEDDKLIKKWEVTADSQGNWSLRQEDLLIDSGVYRLSARTRDARGATSNLSKEHILNVSLSGIAVGSLLISYKDLVLIAIVILVIFLNWLFYLLFKAARTRRLIDQETKDLKIKFYKEYNELKDDIEEELGLLRKLKQGIEFTKEEKQLERKLLENLADVERVLLEELKDIEKIK